MWRALFWAIGVYAILLGAQCLVIDKAVLQARQPGQAQLGGLIPGREVNREIVPPDWAPWTLISAGLITLIYSFTLPKRVGGGSGAPAK
jgi:hypothetical protein